MSQSAIAFSSPVGLPLDAHFDAGFLTSDGGLPWLAEADAALGLTARLARSMRDWRSGPVTHSLDALLRQRIYQIACGYEDQNDATTLRHDPLLKLSCGRLPDDVALASQPTLSRMETSADAERCYHLAMALLDLYLEVRGEDGAPSHILIDADGTDDPTHGHQEGSAYHGYYRQHMYHPLLVFDGDTGQVITAVLRPGTVHAGHGMLAILKRLVHRLRARWPDIRIGLRGDSGFARPELYEWCEAHDLDYTIGLIPNSRLEAVAAPLLAEAKAQYTTTGEKARLAGETQYAAGSWSKERRVIYKAEVLAKGPNTRFVVTTRTDPPLDLYHWYVQRGGGPELWIKDFKDGCFGDRLSCERFWPNQFRLLLHLAAYWLLDTIRTWLCRLHVERMQLDTLRLRLIKIGGWVREHRDRIGLHLASSHPGEPLWHLLASCPRRQ